MKLNPNNAKNLIQKLAKAPFVIYGMGYVGKLIAEWCGENGVAYMFCDGSAEEKRQESGEAVLAPKQLAAEYPDAYVVVASINYYDEIRERLVQLGFGAEQILSYLDFWPEKPDWDELEAAADWDNVRRRAGMFAAWIDPSAESVADFSLERNFLRDFLPETTRYEAPDYIRFRDNIPYAEFSGMDPTFRVEVSSCLAMLMSVQNPEDVIEFMCSSTDKAIIASYVTVDQLPDLRLRRSINYNNDYTERQFIHAFEDRGFRCLRSEQDPFDAVHVVYLFERQWKNRGCGL